VNSLVFALGIAAIVAFGAAVLGAGLGALAIGSVVGALAGAADYFGLLG
jgi:hypothetical protein